MPGLFKAFAAHWKGALSLFVLVTAAGFLLAISLPPTFRATALVTVELPGEPTPAQVTRYLERQREMISSIDTAKVVAQKIRFRPSFDAAAGSPQTSTDWVAHMAGLLNWRNWVDDPYRGIDTATLSAEERERLTYQALLSGLSVNSDPFNGILRISYHDSIPKHAARTANAFAKAYVTAIKTAANSPDTGTAAFESIRVADARQAVATARTALDQYLQEPQNQARFDQVEADRSQLQANQAALSTARSELLQLEFRQGRAQRIDIRFTDPGEIAAIFDSDALATQGRRLKSARDRVEQLDKRMTSEHPEMKAAMRMRDREQERMQELLDKDMQVLDGAVAAARERVRMLSTSTDALQVSTDLTPGGDNEPLAQLRKDLEWAERRLALLLESEQPAVSASAGRKPAATPQLPVVTITEEALPPDTPIRPDRQAIVLTAAAIGIVLGLLLAMLRGARSGRHAGRR